MTDQNEYESRYGLRVPAVGTAARADLDLRPRRIQEWIRQLPLADAQESCRRLHKLLQTANRTPLEPAARYKFADAIHDTIGQVSRVLVRGISHRGFPLTGKALQQADLCTAVQRELADAYKLIAADSLHRGRVDRKLLATAVQHAVQQLGRLLLDHYTLYAPAPNGLWLDLHRLYRIAEDHDLLAPAANSRRAPAGARIGELYRQSLLISLSNPYRLRRGELGRAVTLASALAHKLILSPRPTEHGAFQVRTEQDRPPFVRAHEHDTGGVRYIDLCAVAAALEQDTLTHNEPELQLRERLLALWRRPPRRGFNRISQSTEIRVGVGLNTAHFLLERAAPPIPIPAAPVSPALGVVPPMQSLTEAETRVSFDTQWYDNGSEHFYPTASLPRPEQAYPLPGTVLPEPEYRDFVWRTLDVSARGCCLQWDSDRPSAAKVGEVVALREAEDGNWTVGVVRWMQYEREQGLKLGIEILAPGAEAVVTRSTAADHAATTQDAALELAAVRAAGQPPSLILSSHEHHVGETLEMLRRGRPKRIRLSAELERHGNFAHFVYEPLDGDEPSPGPDAGATNSIPTL